MIVHQVFAHVCDKEIKNIIVCDNYEMANRLARAAYGDEAFAVDCLQYSCGTGDRYHDGIFWRVDEAGNEIEIPYIPTQEQQVCSLSIAQEEVTETLVDLDYRQAALELGLSE